MHDYRPENEKAEEGQNMFGDSFRNYEDSKRQAVVVVNLFGVFSGILDGLCESGTCRGPEQDRLNLMSPHLWGESDGWSYSLLSESMSGVGGVSGGIGIPDIVALVVLAGGWFILSRRK